jgi:hypothetical protein
MSNGLGGAPPLNNLGEAARSERCRMPLSQEARNAFRRARHRRKGPRESLASCAFLCPRKTAQSSQVIDFKVASPTGFEPGLLPRKFWRGTYLHLPEGKCLRRNLLACRSRDFGRPDSSDAVKGSFRPPSHQLTHGAAPTGFWAGRAFIVPNPATYLVSIASECIAHSELRIAVGNSSVNSRLATRQESAARKV